MPNGPVHVYVNSSWSGSELPVPSSSTGVPEHREAVGAEVGDDDVVEPVTVQVARRDSRAGQL